MNVECPSCHNLRDPAIMLNPANVPPPIAERITHEHPDWTPDQTVCEHCVNAARAAEAAHLLIGEMGELSTLDVEVINSLRRGTMVLQNTAQQDELPNLTAAERLSQRVADTIGTFAFSILVLLLVGLWISFSMNSRLIERNPALVFGGLSSSLGTLAAIQNPIILMSQRRQARRDRLRNENDYRVNLKSELEVRYLNQKLDYLMNKLVMQTRLIEEMDQSSE